MKKTIILLLTCNILILNAQNDLFLPPGTIQMNDSLFIDKSPVTNLMFIEYLNVKKVLQNKGYSTFAEFTKATNEKGFPLEMRTTKIPSPLLIDFYSIKKYLSRKDYGKESKFKHHPVLNVSKKQAIDFCKWRTEMASHLWNNDEKYASLKSLSNKITYRLATKNELELAKTFFSNSNAFTVFKEKLFQIEPQKIATVFTLFPINEMTGSDELFNYQASFDYTGFRCVCEIKQ